MLISRWPVANLFSQIIVERLPFMYDDVVLKTLFLTFNQALHRKISISYILLPNFRFLTKTNHLVNIRHILSAYSYFDCLIAAL